MRMEIFSFMDHVAKEQDQHADKKVRISHQEVHVLCPFLLIDFRLGLDLGEGQDRFFCISCVIISWISQGVTLTIARDCRGLTFEGQSFRQVYHPVKGLGVGFAPHTQVR